MFYSKRRKMNGIKRYQFLTFLLFLLWGSAISAQSPDDGNKSITYQCEKKALHQALSDIERLSNYYRMQYIMDDVKPYTVTVSLKDASMKQAMQQLLKSTPLKFEINQQFISIYHPDAKQKTASGTIRGWVFDENGEPLIGVTIKALGTNTGTITNTEGEFSLASNGKPLTLQISYIGKKNIEVKASPSKPLRIEMEDDTHLLNDVVVTGYQTISRERSAGSYDIIKGDDIASKVISTNSVIEGLEGLTTGLSVNKAKGADKYLIRGTTSINSNRSPLFVVDGVPLDESLVEDMINSNDIASITVLKDATAASIWGSQAANGVVVISTKRGEHNQKVKVSYSGSYTYYGKPDYGYYNYMDGEMFIRNAQEMFDEYSDKFSYDLVKSTAVGNAGAPHLICSNSYMPKVWPHEIPMYEYKEGLISESERDAQLARLASLDGRKQYEKYFMSDKWFTQHNLSLRGGSQKHTYFLSVSYKGDQGTSKDWSDKVTVNAYQDFQLAKWLKWDITVNANFGYSKAHLMPWNNDLSTQFNSSSGAQYLNLPYNVFHDENGWVDQSAMVMAPSVRQEVEELTGIDLTFNPVDDFNHSTNKTTNTNIRVNTGLTIDLLKGLTYEGRFQYSRIHSRQETFRTSDSYIVREERAQTYDTSANELRVPSTGGHYTLDNTLTTDWTLRNQLKYDAAFDDNNHQLTLMAGTELRSYCSTSYQNMYRGYDMQTMQRQSYDVYALNNYIMPVPIGSYAVISTSEYYQSETAKRYFSLYANAAYTYLHKYTLNASLRMDQSNLFGSNPSNQYKPIWSVGAAWRISEEAFMKDFTPINELTLRASYGLAGNSPLPGQGGSYDILRATSSSSFETPGFNIITPANDMLTWEKTRTINVGFDTQLFDRRISLSFDYYDKYTTDLIGLVNLNPTCGWFSTTGNLGEMSNRGFELSLSTHNVRSKDFNWHSILTLSYNKNKIEKLDVEFPIELASDLLYTSYIEGYPMGALFSYRYAGLDENGRPQVYDKEGNIVKEYDIENLSKDDMVYSGTTVPKVYGGFTNQLEYKNWELSFMFAFNLGHKMRKDGMCFYGRPGANLLKEVDKRWREPGDEAYTDVPRYSPERDYALISDAYYYADTRVLDASYIRMRDLSLSYTLPTSLCRKLKTERIRISGQIGNLFLIAFNGEGIDPEAYSYNVGNYKARQDKYGPSYSIGLNIDF